MRWRSAVLAVGVLLATAVPATADTAMTLDPAQGILASVNAARGARGLVALQMDSRLNALAGTRASRLASAGVLSHEAAGSITADLAEHGIRWFAYGEDIGFSSGGLSVASQAILRMWTASVVHWDLLMSPRFNYIGIGLHAGVADGLTWASLVMTESPDRTGARAAMSHATVAGNDIRWTWRGWDVPLQTHTAGVRDYAVQLRIDRGPWHTIASATASLGRTTLDRTRRHWYAMRVRARDRAGNVGPWSRELRVWLP